MRKIYMVVLVIVIILLVGASLRIAIPKNPNYNYVTLNVSATVGEKSSNSVDVTFYINATGGTHSFFINSTCHVYNPYGFGLLFENASSANTAKYMGSYYLERPLSSYYNFISAASTPGFNISESRSNVVEQVTFHHLKSGYYFYYMGNFTISGNRRTYVTVNFLDAKSTFNTLNLTLPDKT
jgi:hypothetical protein